MGNFDFCQFKNKKVAFNIKCNKMSYFQPKRGSFNGIIKYFNNNYYSSLYSHVNVVVSSSNVASGFQNKSSIVDLHYFDTTSASEGSPGQYGIIYFPETRVSV